MLKLVIVEDEHLIRKWIKNCLNTSSLEIELVGEASNGLEGSQVIAAKNPDIVLTDLNMPLKTGFEMFEATTHLSYEKIVLSGYNDFHNAREAIKYQVVDFVAKPIRAEELYKALQIAINRCQQMNVNQQTQIETAKVDIGLATYKGNDECVLKTLAYLHQYYPDNHTIAEISFQLGYSESYLYKRFKEEMGLTINQYKTKYRILKALKYMADQPHLKIYEIADAVGFSDYNYFNRVFKKIIGMNASDYKEKLQE